MTRQRVWLVGLVVVAVGGKIGKGMLYDPVQADLQAITSLDRTLRTLRMVRKVQAPVMREQWNDLTGRTLSVDPLEARNILTSELTRMTLSHDLSKPSIRHQGFSVDRETDVVTIPVLVSAQGPLDGVVAFLGDVYDLPYRVRVSQLQLRPVGVRPVNRVVLSARLETLVLPEVHAGIGVTRGVGSLKRDVTSSPRPCALAKDREAYRTIAARRPFHGDRPDRTTPSGPGKPPIRPDDPWAFTLVAGMLSYPRVQEVIVRNTRTRQRRFYRLGDDLRIAGPTGNVLSKGRIVLISADGIMTKLDETAWFFRLGETLATGQCVSAVPTSRRVKSGVFVQ